MVWTSLAIEQFARGAAGSALGTPVSGYRIAPERFFTMVVEQGSGPAPGAWGLLLIAIAGPLAILVVALAAGAVAEFLGAGGMLRGLMLAWAVVALLWLPVAFLAAALPGGGGPVAELYGKLGGPPAGRWTAAALGLVLLGVAAGFISRRAVGAGRRWMRADSVAFRRRLVRVTAGWPAVFATAALALVAGWAQPGWAAGLAAVVLGSLHFRTA